MSSLDVFRDSGVARGTQKVDALREACGTQATRAVVEHVAVAVHAIFVTHAALVQRAVVVEYMAVVRGAVGKRVVGVWYVVDLLALVAVGWAPVVVIEHAADVTAAIVVELAAAWCVVLVSFVVGRLTVVGHRVIDRHVVAA